jgi:putative transposase
MLKEIPRHQFQSCVNRHQGDYRVRQLSCWSQFVAMLSSQLAGRSSLRDLTQTLHSHRSVLYHAGIDTIRRSTLADANTNRSADIYRDLFGKLLTKVQGLAPKYKLKLPLKLYALDATLIELCLSVFPWARFRQRKGALKLHTLIDLDGSLPVFAQVTDATTHDITPGRRVPIPSGSWVVFDKAYIDYPWLYTLKNQAICFVSRLKTNARYRVVQRLKPNRCAGILCDQLIRLTGVLTRKKYPALLRRIALRDPQTRKYLVFFTNDFDLPATTIAQIYKARWEIELFFKTLKQNLKIKTFLGISFNAVLTQIWIALIAYLLLAYFRFVSRCRFSIQQIKRLFEMTLFQRRDLWDLLFQRWRPPLSDNQQLQLCLQF